MYHSEPQKVEIEKTLPALRQDLSIFPSGPFWNGAPSWMIHDGFANKYYRIGKLEFLMLCSWRPISSLRLADNMANAHGFRLPVDTIETFARFLVQNNLIEFTQESRWQALLQQYKKKQPFWKTAMRRYIFFQIPLFNPQPVLDLIWPYVSFLFSKTAAALITLLGLFSMLLVFRQWENFTATFVSFLTIEGFLLYSLSLVFIKTLHEFGHALMAKKYGVEVPVIGIGFILLMPILYTDTTAAHRLTSKWQRLNIDLAGIYAELTLAVLATLLWIFLPDGTLRSLAFTTATVSWVMSLAVNLNPFMRFDGYYILSDLSGFENLQDRGFAFGKWHMRELLFGLNERPPDAVPQSWHMPIVLHAWGTWVYRLFLFLGIAFVVYAFFIKVVGIILFMAEITWFILVPIFRELKIWWGLRSKIMKTRRSFITASFIACLLVACFFPFRTVIEVPAVMRGAEAISLFPPEDGLVTENRLADGTTVNAGQPLIFFSSPDLEEKLIKTDFELALLKARLAQSSFDTDEKSLRLIAIQELAAKKIQKTQLLNKLKKLVYRAPVSGELLDVDQQITAGIWVNRKQQLGLITNHHDLEVFGYFKEEALEEIQAGWVGEFIPDSLLISRSKVRITTYNPVPVDELAVPILAEPHGGQIPVHSRQDPGSGHKISPVGSWYQIKLETDQNSIPDAVKDQITRGIVRLKGKPQSFAARVARRVAGILLREFAP